MYNSNVLSEAYPQQSSGLLLYVIYVHALLMYIWHNTRYIDNSNHK